MVAYGLVKKDGGRRSMKERKGKTRQQAKQEVLTDILDSRDETQE